MMQENCLICQSSSYMDGVPSNCWSTNNICAMCEEEALKLHAKNIGANIRNEYTYIELYKDKEMLFLSILDLALKKLTAR